MLLVIDIGNTNIVAGVYRSGSDKLLWHWRLSTYPPRTADEYALVLKGLFDYHNLPFAGGVKAVVISSVVPPLTPAIELMTEQYLKLKPLIVGPGIKTGMNILYDDPKEVGADRIVNAVAGYSKYGGPLIVVDFGTATTLDAISADGAYLGGAIAPGVDVSSEALFEHAAKLPRIDLARPKTVIGKTTVASMQSGIVFGFAGQVDALVRRMMRELNGKVKVVATGGLAELIAPETATIETVDPLLTLEGLRLIYLKNKE